MSPPADPARSSGAGSGPNAARSLAAANILETHSLVKSFGGLVASDHVNFTLHEGELRCLIGPNGAGKTTFFNLLSGHIAPDEGRIFFQGRNITGLPLHVRARLGIGRKYQSPNLFDDLSVADNIRVSSRGKCSPFSLFSRRQDPAFDKVVDAVLDKVRLGEKRNLQPPSFPTGSGSGSRSRWCWPTSRACSCWMSRRRA